MAGLYNVRGPCRPPPPSSRSCSPRRAPVDRRARCRPAPAHRRDRARAQPPAIDGRLDDPAWAAAAAVGRVRAALSRRGRAAERAHHDARPLRRQEPVRRHRLRAGERADREAPRAPRLADPVRRRLDRHRQPAHRRRRVPLRGQRRRHAVGRHPLRRHELLQRLGRGLGGQGRRHRTAATRSSSASRCRCCASRRCRCRTGASRCGASSTRARRPTTGRSTRAAPRPSFRCSAGSTTCATCSRAMPLELRPFVLGRVGHRSADADTTLTHGWSADGSAGLDAKAHVTNELTLDLALNPDFGQVEADTVVLNLSTYETFFPEKRPFFLEGIDVFSTVRPLVYTRRIGQQPATPTLMQQRTAGRAARAGAALRRGEAGRHDRRAHDRRPDLGDHRPQRRRDRHGRRARGSGGWNRGRRSTSCASSASWPPTPRSACWRRRPTASRRRCRPARSAR